MEIIIKQAILHILDTNIASAVISDTCLELTADLKEFLRGHLSKAYESDDCKDSIFNQSSEFLNNIMSGSDEFVGVSQKIGNDFFHLMKKNPGIPGGDVIVLSVIINHAEHLAILKMNYRESYIHYFQPSEQGKSNTIIKQRTALPSVTNKLDEAIFIDFKRHSVKVIEKKYEINGVKEYYLSTYLLECATQISEKQKLNIIKETGKSIAKNLCYDEKLIEAKTAAFICEKSQLQEEVSMEELSANVYGDKPDAKAEFTKTLKAKNIESLDTLKVSERSIKKIEKQSISASSGVEIKIPVNIYNTPEYVEFINNPDGTVSLLIKNIIL